MILLLLVNADTSSLCLLVNWLLVDLDDLSALLSPLDIDSAIEIVIHLSFTLFDDVEIKTLCILNNSVLPWIIL